MAKLFQLATVLLFIAGTVRSQINNNTFPDGFSFGAATAAYQIEGAWNEDLKGESIWDHYVHLNDSRIKNNETADVSCDSYHKYKDDVAMAVSLNLTHYRFSISWPRILPSGFNNIWSVKGILYYQNLIRELEKYNITPVVTMYHWDLPESVQDIGGWTNPEIVNYFTDYAEILLESFPSVKHWITINEPKQVCVGGYGEGSEAPGIKSSGEGDYICAHNVIKAHATVYRLYQEKFAKTEAKISMGLDCPWNIPKSNSTADKEAAERKLQFDFGLYAHPLIFGDWPDIVKQRVENRSLFEGFNQSRLPSFTKEEQTTIKGTLDYISLNFYDTNIVEDAEEASNATTSLDNDIRITESVDSSWKTTITGQSIYPAGLRNVLKWLKEEYNKTIFISENGIPDDGSTLNDYDRMDYLQDYLGAVLDSIYLDNVTVTGYTMWSLMDNFEWTDGYSLHYGIYWVNFDDVNKTRIAKMSADYYRRVIQNHKIIDPHDITTPVPLPTTTTSPTTITTTPTKTTTTTETTVTTSEPTSEPSSANSYSLESSVIVITLCFFLTN